MRSLLLVSTALVLLAVPACAAEDQPQPFVLPSWMDVDFAEPVPAFDDLLAGADLPDEACDVLLASAASIPFESTPAEVTRMADELEALGPAVPQLEPAIGVVSGSLRTAAERGADRQAMLGPWFERSTRTAIRELSYLVMAQCSTPAIQLSLGPTDRLIDLAEADHPDSDVLADIGSWSMSITGTPQTIYWSFGYLGDDPVGLCRELVETLASAGFAGTELTVHDAELRDDAVGTVGGSCRPA